ncbi:YqaE/Pmp3 family membrane protein [Vibrio parahaemolyticus]|uniref:YqaE/Pmp3 family membrane protein n=1 Tax=Vibrio parahaemolyticus TaxID=670 RepID=UPI0004DAAB66|nr:YqaE/Pmp3 family membrane protein [Vibrio parahaemolyticus]EIQ1511506.1 YqaE/Pmp3 family membrane protein [Vibrio parahaemolyticus]EJT1883356.1 YqaE/Pmp3 family membrane protein [Vibrio parahaemolyticus]ELB2772506.1 YqaE/Pmp3 family membrane protein [Vibrio parahaemolyticus]OQU03661.1 proteolipid membrane potential modulator [Vibrio parahaemolyticus]
MDTKKLILILLCIFLPPVAVYMEKGLNKDFFINLILTFFFFLPGTIHALWSTMK